MSQRLRPLVVLATCVAVAAPAGAVLLIAAPAGATTPAVIVGSSSPSWAALLQPARPSAAAQTPTAVQPAAVGRPAAATRIAARPAAPAVRAILITRRTSTAKPALQPAPQPARPAPVAKPAPKPAPKPAASPSAAPKPAPKPTSSPTAAQSAPSARGDDYPWRTDTTNYVDDWGFTRRQCVSFAAFRLAQRGQALDNRTQHWGSALTWDDTAAGQGVAVSGKPRVGAIAQWNAGESSPAYVKGSSTPNAHFAAGSYGHVAYVAGVYADGSVLVEQYNGDGGRSYSTLRLKAPRYLIF